MNTKTDNHAEEQAAAQYSSIVRMLAAVECDYDRLEELRDDFDALEGEEKAAAELGRAEWPSDCTTNPGEDLIYSYDIGRELAELEDAAGDCIDEDDARQRISEDPLSVEVRSDWTTPGEELEAAEFCILLCTGGPAVRIVGELNRGEPCRAWLEYQDWGTPWT
jgi:hypothetical protein